MWNCGDEATEIVKKREREICGTLAIRTLVEEDSCGRPATNEGTLTGAANCEFKNQLHY